MSYKKVIAEWAKETLAGLPEDVRKLIGEANFDLSFGPKGGGLDEEESTYPGFVPACHLIRDALSDALPSSLYVDDQDCWHTSEPTGEDEDFCGYYTEVSHSEMVRAIVGRDLAEYVR